MALDYLHLFAPECLLFVTALVAWMTGLSSRRRVRRAVPWIALAGAGAALTVFWRGGLSDEPLVLPGVCISSLTEYVRLIALVVGLLVLLINRHLPESSDCGVHFAMILFSLTGVLLTAGADDLVVLFLGLQLASVPTYVLVTAATSDIRTQEAGMKYFFLGALAAAILAYGFSFLYGVAGTTRMATMTLDFSSSYGAIGLLLVIGALTFKIAAVPFHAYVPDVYQGAASPVVGLLGFFPKLAGFVAMLKILALVAPAPGVGSVEVLWVPPKALFWTLWVMAALTMTVGNCLALFQTNVKRVLAYSSIAHSGYILVAILVGPAVAGAPLRDGWSAALFYLLAFGVANLGAFAVLAYLRIGSRSAEELDDLAGMAHAHPAAALAMAVCLFSLMGMPPTVGFFGRVYVFSGAVSVGKAHPHQTAMLVLALIGVVNTVVAAAYYLRVISACYTRDPQAYTEAIADRPLRLGIALCTVFVLVAGLWPRDLLRLSDFAASHFRRPAELRLDLAGETRPSRSEAPVADRAPPPTSP